MPSGYCGGHDPIAKRKITGRKPLSIPMEQAIARYEAGETYRQIAADLEVNEDTLRHRLVKAGVRMRPSGAKPGHGPLRKRWVETADLVAAWDQGLTWREITAQFDISRASLYKRLWEAFGNPDERRLRTLYVEEELPLSVVRERLGIGTTTLLARLQAMGIDVRERAGVKQDRVAQTPALGRIRRAAIVRRSKRTGDHALDRLTSRQRDLLDILRAAPEPISTGRIHRVAAHIPRSWRLGSSSEIHTALLSLSKRGLVSSFDTVGAELGHRGRKIVLWLPSSDHTGQAKSAEDACRLREIQLLIEAQESEASFGEREAGQWSHKSLDAPLTEDGLTILDALGDEDEDLSELLEEAA